MTCFSDHLRRSPIIPVLVVDRVEHAEPLATALAAGGLTVVEVTLRTPAALEVIRCMKQVSGLTVGAGTVLTSGDVDNAVTAGADFIVTPGTPISLVPALRGAGVPVIPGVQTVSEILTRIEDGFQILKLFPAEQCGGVGLLKAIAGPLPSVQFCPTGGIDQSKASAYLALKSVVAVGGSWIAPASALAAENWDLIAVNARNAALLGTAKES